MLIRLIMKLVRVVYHRVPGHDNILERVGMGLELVYVASMEDRECPELVVSVGQKVDNLHFFSGHFLLFLGLRSSFGQ